MISNTTFVIQYNLLSNGWLKTLYFMAFMATVENNILNIMFASVTPIGPPEKCKVAAYAEQEFF